MEEIHLSEGHIQILNITLGSLGLLMSIFFLIHHWLKKSQKTLVYQIKFELVIACILCCIGILLPVRGEVDRDISTIQAILCYSQAFLFSFPHFSVIFLFTVLPYITYLVLNDSKIIEENPRRFHFIIITFTWCLPIIMTIFFSIFGDVFVYHYFCWFRNEVVVYFYFGINIIYLILLGILFFKLKKTAKKFVDQNKYEDSYIVDYSKGLRNIIIVFILINCHYCNCFY